MTNEWNPEQPVPGTPSPGQPPSPRPGQSPRPPLSPAERRQRNLIIALSIGAVLVLIAGMIAFVATGDGGESTAPSSVLPVTSTSLADELVVTTLEPAPTTIETTTTVPSTTVVIPANADAGEDLVVDQSVEFMLVAADLAEGTPGAAVRWTQTAGPDVTAGVGSLRGAEAVAVAPSAVTTLAFTLEVAGTDGVATDDVIVRVFESASEAVFVDGERGDDGADGSITAPLRTLAAAVQSAPGRDLYVRSVGIYDTTSATLELSDGMSLYGGFDDNWVRDTNQRVVIEGAAIALRATGSRIRSISAVEITAGDASPGNNSVGIVVQDAGIVRVLDSRIVGGDGSAGADGGAGGRSSGVVVNGAAEVRIERSTVNAGQGGSGADGVPVEQDAALLESAESGRNGSGRDRGDGGGTGAGGGGRGGDGGNTSAGADAPGGAAGGTSGAPDGRPGSGGSGGGGGIGGNGGVGAVIADDGATVPVGRTGVVGNGASNGSGGTGGGGGNGPLLVDGGGGAGGGAGGAASVGAGPGGGGGGSIGLWTVDVDRLVIVESLVAGGRAGNGGDGAVATSGQVGGSGGLGAEGVDGLLADGGAGGGAGGGGAGGTGGQGGGGAGGPSYGLLTTNVVTVEVSATTVRGGGGGNGADGGGGGAPGLGGADGSGRTGGAGGSPSIDVAANAGAGASGGASYGWFDDNAAGQLFDAAQFIEGSAGNGGSGLEPGDDGVAVAANV